MLPAVSSGDPDSKIENVRLTNRKFIIQTTIRHAGQPRRECEKNDLLTDVRLLAFTGGVDSTAGVDLGTLLRRYCDSSRRTSAGRL